MDFSLTDKKLLNKIKNFLKKPYEYEFTQAVWFLESLVRTGLFQSAVSDSEQPSSNRDYSKVFGHIQFKATIHYNSPPTAIDRIDFLKADGFFQPVLWINFTGIAGIQGPLALVYTERIFRNLRENDKAGASFLDIFNHKIISLIYESQKGIPGFVSTPPHETPIGQLMMALGGISDFQQSAEVNKNLAKYLITYRNLFWKRIRSSSNLKRILSSFFHTTVTIEEFQGAYVAIDPQETSRIGHNQGTCYTLGRDLFLGDRLWRQDRKIHIFLHNLDSNFYETFNPYQESLNLQHLINISRHYITQMISFKFFVSTRPADKKVVILGQKHFLGFDTWLNFMQTTEDRPHLICI